MAEAYDQSSNVDDDHRHAARDDANPRQVAGLSSSDICEFLVNLQTTNGYAKLPRIVARRNDASRNEAA